MDFWLPPQTRVDKYIPKNKFYEKAVVSSKLKQDFINQIQKITRIYKLAEDTLWIDKTESVEEIQIFEIQLKQQVIPKKVLKLIDKSIPYPILYVFIYEDNTAYGITLKDDPSKPYFFSEWNKEMNFDFNKHTLETVYQWLVTSFIVGGEEEATSFEEIVDKDKQRKMLEKEIQILENKVRREKQFNKQVALNQELQARKKQLQSL